MRRGQIGIELNRLLQGRHDLNQANLRRQRQTVAADLLARQPALARGPPGDCSPGNPLRAHPGAGRELSFAEPADAGPWTLPAGPGSTFASSGPGERRAVREERGSRTRCTTDGVPERELAD